MNQKRSKSNERRARGDSEYGLVRRVSRKLGKSERWISDIKNGVYFKDTPAVRSVLDALERERAAMREEQHVA